MTEDQDAVFGVRQSANGRAWRLRSAEPRLVAALSQRLELPEAIARLLAGRGVGIEEAVDFLNPSLRQLMPDPHIMQDMATAARRVAQAIIAGERVAVFGDYDVDGATSSAMLTRYFRALGRDLVIYIPDRLGEGYGPNAPALLNLKNNGVSLVITVDCGTLAFAPLAAARAAGLDVIVVDHHLAEPALPEACAVVNPNRLDDDSGLGQLAAVGVAFMLTVAVNRALREQGFFVAGRREPDLMALLDLVALGTVADVVPLTGLNRAFVAQGLKVLARGGNIGLKALAAVARMNETPSAYHLGFLLGPRVNAGGRVGEADLGARLLITEDVEEAGRIAAALDRYNQERQAIEAQVQEVALSQLAARHGLDVPPPLAFAVADGWHIGVIGIVAGRLKDRFDLPAVVIGMDGDVGKGSARSIGGVDIGAAVTAAHQAGLLINGGGHKMAAGLTIARDKLSPFEDFLRERLTPQVAAAHRDAALMLDGVLTAGAATVELLDLLERAGPYGAGNPTPRFAFSGLKVGFADIVGADHVRATFEGPDGKRLKGIAFKSAANGLGQMLLGGIGQRFHVAGTLKRNVWNGRTSVDLIIEDAAAAS
ncbi:MAG: single-stranded-DNA-specific exonuclease RecJ [Sphingomonadales bacterium]|nr:single-stranded-DNA-specific exonuclease RecJ [Sphingomonadales bacterium]